MMFKGSHDYHNMLYDDISGANIAHYTEHQLHIYEVLKNIWIDK